MKNSTLHSFVQLFHYIRPLRKDYAKAAFYSFFSKFIDILPEILLGIAINTVVEKENAWLARLGFTSLKIQLLLLSLMTLMVYGLGSLFEYLYSVKWWRLTQRLQHNFRVAAFEHVQQSTMASFSKQKTGNLLSILNDDINQLERFFEEGIDSIVDFFCSVLLTSITFFVLAPKVALLVMLPIPLIIYGNFFFQAKLGPLYFTVRQKAGALGARLANSLLGMLTVKSLVAEQLEATKIRQASQAYQDANFNAIRWHAMVSPVLRFAVLWGFIVTLIYGGFLVAEGQLDLGAYSTLVFLTQRLLTPFVNMAEIMINFRRAMASAARLLQLFQLPREVSPNIPLRLRGKITFSSVSFAYEQHAPTLNKLSFTILPGQTVAFVGATGAGKSTLLKLLLGFYLPTAGKVFFDAQELRTISLPALRRQIGFVSQEPFLFEGTIAENISYALPTATREQIVQAAKNAAAHEFVIRLPQGYDTRLEGRDYILSGGQKQRISIARALVRDPAILILDEATSAVDNATELAIQKSLAKISQGRTTLLIAHRLSTVKQADQIFVLKSGEIVEQGTHHTLLKQDGLYANLWKLQTGENLTHAELLAEE
ncbi:MAG: ABC transporter ATP-binding protein/permease [Amoebophilaceae bacterium]|jgi:ATP-binding cassette subfamily B protein|nr:ABC transporter ATP-binding protein/permease [Amoebophilaceae bacterium]